MMNNQKFSKNLILKNLKEFFFLASPDIEIIIAPLIDIFENVKDDNIKGIEKWIKNCFLFQKNIYDKYNFELNFKIAAKEWLKQSDIDAIIYIYGLLAYINFLSDS